MVSARKVRTDLVVTAKDLKRVMTPELRNLMIISPNAGFAIKSNYAFQCVCCRDMGLDYSWYTLLKETVGPYARKTEPKTIKSHAKGIVRLAQLKSKPKYSSHLNATREGFVCDHCNDSVYN